MKLCKLIILIGGMCCVLSEGMAQSVRGKVTDTGAHPVDGATVVLQTLDSVFVDAVITDADGVFTVARNLEHYRLIVQHLLYQTVEKECRGADAGVIVLAAKDYELKEVVVKGERPLVRVEKGRLAYDMPQLLAGKLVNSVYEAILRLPGIMEQDGSLTLAGAGAVSLILNGKPSSMTYAQMVELLKGIPASRAGRVEVMYSAPPQYHVRGAAVNILLKGYQSGASGLQGEVNGDYVQSNEAGAGGGVSLAYASPRFDADFMFQISRDYNRQGNDFITSHTVGSEVYDVLQSSEGDGRSTASQLRLGGTWRPNDKHRLSLAYTTDFTPDDKSRIESWGNRSETLNRFDENQQMHNVQFDYQSGFGLKVGTDYTRYSSKKIQDFTGKSAEGENESFWTDDRQQINRWKVYADQTHSLPDSWTLHYGSSFSYVDNSNTQCRKNVADGGTFDNKIREYTYNLYAGFEKNFNKRLSLSASVAGEYYRMMDYRKWAVYPTMQLSYVVTPSHILQLSFHSDKKYPDYWILSGAVSYLNDYQEAVGNAALKPYTVYTGNLTYILRRKYVFQAGYRYMPHYFTQMVYLSPSELRAVYNYQNWDYTKQFSLTSVLPFRIGDWWNSQLTLNLVWKRDKASAYYDAPFDNRRWVGIGIWNNTFTLSHKPDLKMEVKAFGQTKGIQGSYVIEPLGYVDAAFRYTFCKQKAVIQLEVNDIFDSYHPQTCIRNGNQIVDMKVRNYQRNLTVSFRYSFGGYKAKKEPEVDASRFGF